MLRLTNISNALIYLSVAKESWVSTKVQPGATVEIKSITWELLKVIHKQVLAGTLTIDIPEDSPLNLFLYRSTQVLKPVANMAALHKLNKTVFKGGEKVTVIDTGNGKSEKFVWTGNKFTPIKEANNDFSYLGALKSFAEDIKEFPGHTSVISNDGTKLEMYRLPNTTNLSTKVAPEEELYLKTSDNGELLVGKDSCNFLDLQLKYYNESKTVVNFNKVQSCVVLGSPSAKITNPIIKVEDLTLEIVVVGCNIRFKVNHEYQEPITVKLSVTLENI